MLVISPLNVGHSARLLILCLASLSSLSELRGDTVELSGGGHLSGDVERRGDATIVTVDDRLQIAVRPSRVRRVVRSEELSKYHEMAAKLGDDPDKHYELGVWCMSDHNVPGNPHHYKRYHMQRAIELDTDHAKARGSLGYKKHEGTWVLTSELMRDRGMISKAGRWEVPEAVALEEAQGTSNTGAKKWIREVKRLTKVALKNSSVTREQVRSQEAWETLRGIDDPLAATAIAKQLADSRGNRTQGREIRRLWVRLLGKFRNSVSVRALVLAGIEEHDELLGCEFVIVAFRSAKVARAQPSRNATFAEQKATIKLACRIDSQPLRDE